MTVITCPLPQVPAQIARHHANAILRALRRGPVFEHADAPWRISARPPNSPVNLPVSDNFKALRNTVAAKERYEQRLESGWEPTPEERGAYGAVLARFERIVQDIRTAAVKEAEWPYVAGLYGIHVPPLEIRSGPRRTQLRAFTAYRVITLDDRAAIWPALRTVLEKQPRGTASRPAPAFRVMKLEDKQTYQREQNMPKDVAAWLVGLATTGTPEDGDHQPEQPGLELEYFEPGDHFTDPWNFAPEHDPYAAHLVLLGDCL